MEANHNFDLYFFPSFIRVNTEITCQHAFISSLTEPQDKIKWLLSILILNAQYTTFKYVQKKKILS